MKKTIFYIIAILSLGIIMMLGREWQQFKHHSPEKASQTIMINAKGSVLSIVQTFKNLNPKHNYKVESTPFISKWTCLTKDGRPCKSNKNSFQVENGELSIQYTLNINQRKHSFLLTNWLAKLEGIPIQKTKIEIVETDFRKGSWVSGLSLEGFNQFKYINYYVFSGSNADPPLYWQDVPLYLIQSNRNFSTFVQNPGKKNLLSIPKLNDLDKYDAYLSFVQTDKYPPIILPGMMITNKTLTVENAQNELFVSYFINKFGVSGIENRWLGDFFASILLEKSPETKKGQFVMNEIKRNLTSDEIQSLLKLIQKDKIQIKDLDDYLGQNKSSKTDFFSTNIDHPQQFLSLLYYDQRAVIINGKLVDPFYCLKFSNQIWVPFFETMEHLGYTVKIQNQTILLTKNKVQYDFVSSQNRFYKNGQEYGFLENPFMVRNNILFVSQDGLSTIFNIKLSESSKAISLFE